MTLKVIGAGYGRNGTLSLKHALEKLGFDKCYHMMEVVQERGDDVAWLELARGGAIDFDHVFAGYQASVDWPSCNFWREQLAWSPDAKVILSERDPEKWYASIMNTIYPMSLAVQKSKDPLMQRRSEMVFAVIWDGLFDGRMDDKDHVIDVYLKHNQAWAPLCEFLDVPVPDEPYPRVNTTEDFNTMMEARRAERAERRD